MLPQQGDLALYISGGYLVDIQGQMDPGTQTVSCTWRRGTTFISRHLPVAELFIVRTGTTLDEALKLAPRRGNGGPSAPEK